VVELGEVENALVASRASVTTSFQEDLLSVLAMACSIRAERRLPKMTFRIVTIETLPAVANEVRVHPLNERLYLMCFPSIAVGRRRNFALLAALKPVKLKNGLLNQGLKGRGVRPPRSSPLPFFVVSLKLSN
jgi:hypothetical protein